MRQKGFTLIELLVVIVIIGILATISTATFSSYQKQARDAERQTFVRNFAQIMAAHQVDMESGNAPERGFDNPTGITTSSIQDGIDAMEAVNTLLINQGYQFPPTKAGHNYGYIADPNSYALVVCSEANPGEYFVAGDFVLSGPDCSAADGTLIHSSGPGDTLGEGSNIACTTSSTEGGNTLTCTNQI